MYKPSKTLWLACSFLVNPRKWVMECLCMNFLYFSFPSPGSAILHIDVHHTILYYTWEVVQYFMVERCACRPCRCRPRTKLLKEVGSPACQKAYVLGCFPNGKTDQNNIKKLAFFFLYKRHLEYLSLFDLVDLSAVVFSWLQMPGAMRPKPSWRWPPPFMTPTF